MIFFCYNICIYAQLGKITAGFEDVMKDMYKGLDEMVKSAITECNKELKDLGIVAYWVVESIAALAGVFTLKTLIKDSKLAAKFKALNSGVEDILPSIQNMFGVSIVNCFKEFTSLIDKNMQHSA